jgi:adenylate cyclase
VSGRTYEELVIATKEANNRKDILALEQCAAELEAVGTDLALAGAAGARGNASLLRGDLPAALSHYQHAQAIHEAISNRIGVASIVGNIGIVHFNTGSYHEALEAFQWSLGLYEELGNLSGVAIFSGNIGNVLCRLGREREAFEVYERSIHIHEELNEPFSQCHVTANLAGALTTIGDYPGALVLLRRNLEILESLNDRSGIATTLCLIGNVYNATSDYPVALEHYRRALGMNEESGHKRGIAELTSNMGSIYGRLGDHSTSLEWYEKAAALNREMNDQSGLANALASIGLIRELDGDEEQAIVYGREAIAIYEEIGEISWVAEVLGSIVRSMTKLGATAEAKKLLERIDALPLKGPFGQCHRLRCHATVQKAEGLVDDAIESLNAALAVAEEYNLRSEQAEIHESLRDLCQHNNDFAGYILHNNEFTRITEEINGKDTAAKLAMQEKQREIDAREREHEKQLAVLHSTLPKHVAERVARGEVVNDHFENAAVIFLDIVGFTDISSSMSSQEVIELLDDVFTQCDAICAKHGVTKIKTIGDSYMCVSFDSVVTVALAAMEMMKIESKIKDQESNPSMLQYRIGIHCGPVTAGVIGKERMQYDVWGDTVNVASRMESSGEPGRVHVSEAFASNLKSNQESRVKNPISESHEVSHEVSHAVSHEVPLVTRHSSLVTQLRGSIDIKGKGVMNTYWLEMKQ